MEECNLASFFAVMLIPQSLQALQNASLHVIISCSQNAVSAKL